MTHEPSHPVPESHVGLPVKSMLSVLGPDGRITIGEVDELTLRRLSRARGLRCPHCENAVRYRHGPKRTAHFAHRPGAACVDHYGEPDGPVHRAMKLEMLDWLRRRYRELTVALEVRIETEQRADVLATTVEGRRLAVEVQYSPLDADSWRERHDLYASASVRDLWLLHPRRVDMTIGGPAEDRELRAIGGVRAAFTPDALVLALCSAGHPLLVLDPEEPATVTFLMDAVVMGASAYAVAISVPLADDQLRLSQGTLVYQPLQQALLERDARRGRAVARGAAREAWKARTMAEQLALACEEVRAWEARQAMWRAHTARHPIWPALVASGTVPPDPDKVSPMFGVPLAYGGFIRVDPRLWQAHLFYQHLHSDQHLQPARIAEWLHVFAAHMDMRCDGERLTRMWLGYLVAIGMAEQTGHDVWFVQRPPAEGLPDPQVLERVWRLRRQWAREAMAQSVRKQNGLWLITPVQVATALELEPTPEYGRDGTKDDRNFTWEVSVTTARYSL